MSASPPAGDYWHVGDGLARALMAFDRNILGRWRYGVRLRQKRTATKPSFRLASFVGKPDQRLVLIGELATPSRPHSPTRRRACLALFVIGRYRVVAIMTFSVTKPRPSKMCCGSQDQLDFLFVSAPKEEEQNLFFTDHSADLCQYKKWYQRDSRDYPY
jgi:hypothetical protein